MPIQSTSDRPRKPLAERFWTKVDTNGPIPQHCPELGNCWVWTGATQRKGYGTISRGGHQGILMPAHRASWEIHYGPIPDDLWILHHCDNPPCVRPTHLFTGTPQDNTADMMAKARGATGDRHYLRIDPEKALRGALNPQAKLSPSQVLSIRSRYAEDGTPVTQLAREFGVSHTCISEIIHRKKWQHL